MTERAAVKPEILIAEDSPTQAARLVHLLEQNGYAVMAARNGREALELLEHLSPALIITDVVMPAIDGYRLCKTIKADPARRDIPVMLVTTLADPEDVIRGLECGADNFVRKPYDEAYLLSRIQYLLMNRALRKNNKMQLGIEITFAGQTHFITSERQQILDLLISTYEQAVQINNDLKLREKDLGETNHVLNAMYRIAEGLNRAGTTAEVTELVLDRAMELQGVQAGWILLREGTEFRMAAARNLPPGVAAAVAANTACACLQRVTEGSTEAVTNILECERLETAGDATRGFRRHASIPLIANGQAVGVMNLVGPEEGLFGDAELRTLENIANQIAVALDRTHVREHLEHLVEERTATLREREALLRIASRVGRLGGWVVELPEMTASWSEEMKAIYEVPPDFVPTVEFALDSVAPEYLAKVEKAWAACLRDGTPFDVEAQIIIARERRVWVRLIGQAERDAAGVIRRVHGAFQDISGTKEAAEQSRVLANRLVDTLESITDAFWTVDRSGRITYLNKQGEQLLQRSREELVGKVLMDEFSPARGTAFEAAYNRAMFDGEPVSFEEFYEPLGIWVDARIFPSPQGVTVFARDVTDKRKTAEQLRQSESRYRLLFDRNPRPTWVYDTETLQFLAVNDAALSHYGFSRDEFLNMTIKDIRPPEEVAELVHLVRECGQGSGAPTFGSVKHRKKDGTIIEVEISANEIDFGGRHARLVQAIDVTEKRRLEQQFLRIQRMESIGTLAGGIAHDLNNLLMPIMMGVTLLKRENPSERALRALDNIEKSAARGKALVQQVLSFARGVEGSRVPVHLGDVVREIRSIIESTFPKDIALRLDLASDLWWIEADPTQLHQVLLNLCVNARDAMPAGGAITISTRNEEIDEHYAAMQPGLSPGKYVVLDVTDQGTGMSREVVDRIFEPFFTTKETGQGTGLGLPTVASIVRSHSGVVTVYSEPGKGSTFRVYLPAREARQEAVAPTEEAALDRLKGNGELIMVVDDELSVLTTTQETLEAFGYRAVCAEDGAQAMGLFATRRSEIAVVITDMMMPIMDGVALIAAIRRIDPKVPIVASSGLHDDVRIRKAAQADVRHFLQKPYPAEVLLGTLHDILANRSSR